MSCLNVRVTNFNSPPHIEVERLGKGLQANVSRNGGLSVNVDDITPKMKVGVYMVCTLNRDKYLQVAPDILWLTPDTLGE